MDERVPETEIQDCGVEDFAEKGRYSGQFTLHRGYDGNSAGAVDGRRDLSMELCKGDCTSGPGIRRMGGVSHIRVQT